MAAAQGQKIYTITREVHQNNPGIVQSGLYALSSSTKQAIQNALDAGHEVTTHEAPITQSGWTGAGFIAIDPDTGAGGYVIDGGSNGGALIVQGGSALLVIIKIVNLLRIAAIVAAGINPFVMLFVGIVTLIAGALTDDSYQKTAASLPLTYISSLTVMGTAFFAGGALLPFAFVFMLLLIYVSLLVRDLVFASIESRKIFMNRGIVT